MESFSLPIVTSCGFGIVSEKLCHLRNILGMPFWPNHGSERRIGMSQSMRKGTTRAGEARIIPFISE